jgi:hypothetical protein
MRCGVVDDVRPVVAALEKSGFPVQTHVQHEIQARGTGASLRSSTHGVVQTASPPAGSVEGDMKSDSGPAAFALSAVGAGGNQTRRQFMHAGARIGAQAIVVSASFGMRGRLARAQSSANVTRVGFVAPGPRPTTERPNMFLKAFQEGLRTLGLPESEMFVIGSAPWVWRGLSRTSPSRSGLRRKDIEGRSSRGSADWRRKQVRTRRKSPNGSSDRCDDTRLRPR